MDQYCERLEGRQLFSSVDGIAAGLPRDKIPTTATVKTFGRRMYIQGTNGNDTISITSLISNSAAILQVSLNGATQTVQGTGIRSIIIDAYAGNDTVTIGNLGNSPFSGVPYIFGGAGDDTLTSANRAYLNGGDGNDVLKVTVGPAIIKPGSGFNTVTYPNGKVVFGGGITVTGIGTGNIAIKGSKLDDTFTFTRSGTGTAATIILTATTALLGGGTTTGTTVFNVGTLKSISLNAGAGNDTTVLPVLPFGKIPFSQTGVETQTTAS